MNKLIIILSILLLSAFTCGTSEEILYRNDTYKAYSPSHKITDLGIINHFFAPADSDSFWVYFVPYRFEEIITYPDFVKKFGTYKDTIGVDSAFFVKNRILCFNIITEAGTIESYSYEITGDSLVLNCKVQQQQERENGFLVPKTLTAYVISLGSEK